MASVLCLQGCTLVGLGVGAGIDSLAKGPLEGKRYEDAKLRQGEHIALTSKDHARYMGDYAGYIPPTESDPRAYVVIEPDDSDGTLVKMPVDEVAEVGVKSGKGKGWLYGMLIGAAVDATVIVATVIMMGNIDYSIPSCDGTNSNNCWL